jgi:hypothetical protein
LKYHSMNRESLMPDQALKPVETQLPAEQDEFLALTEQYAERGVSFKQEDQLIPMIYVLQQMSPSVDKRGTNYINGAEAGDFWLRSALEPIRNGEDGIAAIPVEMYHTWIEWLPNRGGFVARHDAPPKDMVSKMVRGDDGREKTALVRGNGNLIVETREFYILVDGDPYVFPCSSTKHTFAKSWQTMFHRFKHPKTGKILPAFAHKYRLSTIPASNALGKWFGLKFEDMGETPLAELKKAIAFSEAIARSEVRPEAPIDGGKEEDIPF